MLLRTKLQGKSYEFPDIRLLNGKANEEKSGDRLAGVGAETARISSRKLINSLADHTLCVAKIVSEYARHHTAT